MANLICIKRFFAEFDVAQIPFSLAKPTRKTVFENARMTKRKNCDNKKSRAKMARLILLMQFYTCQLNLMLARGRQALFNECEGKTGEDNECEYAH